jgi:uncharacterized protein
VLVLGAMPVLTAALAAATGSLQNTKDGWIQVVLLYLLFLTFGAVTAILWEETVWAGFVQGRLMARRGLLAFETDGWSGT